MIICENSEVIRKNRLCFSSDSSSQTTETLKKGSPKDLNKSNWISLRCNQLVTTRTKRYLRMLNNLFANLCSSIFKHEQTLVFACNQATKHTKPKHLNKITNNVNYISTNERTEVFVCDSELTQQEDSGCVMSRCTYTTEHKIFVDEKKVCVRLCAPYNPDYRNFHLHKKNEILNVEGSSLQNIDSYSRTYRFWNIFNLKKGLKNMCIYAHLVFVGI